MPRVSSAVAITACDIVRIDRQRATQEIVQNPELALALMKYLARTVRLLSEHIDNMAFLQTDQRIARYLLSLPQSSNSVIRCTQDEIASAVSANRVTVCRILNQFVKSGHVGRFRPASLAVQTAGAEQAMAPAKQPETEPGRVKAPHAQKLHGNALPFGSVRGLIPCVPFVFV